jgi:chromate transport protein ChrA
VSELVLTITYDPFEVLKLSRWIDLALKAMIGVIILQSLLNISTSWRIAQSYFIQQPNSIWVYLFTLAIVAVNIVLAILLTYIPLKALSKILRILMEMEFRSRKQTK